MVLQEKSGNHQCQLDVSSGHRGYLCQIQGNPPSSCLGILLKAINVNLQVALEVKSKNWSLCLKTIQINRIRIHTHLRWVLVGLTEGHICVRYGGEVLNKC